jgi:predicted phosphodiesterase
LKTPELWVAVFDLHYPQVNWPTWNAILDFCKKNKVSGFIFGGDQFDNAEISHHNRNKPIFKERASYKRNTDGFTKNILDAIEPLVKGERVWIVGNHDDWERQLVESMPELEGSVERELLLGLEKRKWNVVPLGHAYKLGKLHVIHGEVLTGIGNQAGAFPSKKAVELYAGSVLAGHTHAPQSYTRISPVNSKDKWMGWIAPIAGGTNPIYLRNRPTAWANGFVIVEKLEGGNFNCYPVIVSNGKFSYGGKVYGND